MLRVVGVARAAVLADDGLVALDGRGKCLALHVDTHDAVLGDELLQDRLRGHSVEVCFPDAPSVLVGFRELLRVLHAVLFAHVERLAEAVDQLEVGDVADDGVALLTAAHDLAGDEVDVLDLAIVNWARVDGLVLPGAHGKLDEALPAHLELGFHVAAVLVGDDVRKAEVRVDRELHRRRRHRRAEDGHRIGLLQGRRRVDEAQHAGGEGASPLAQHIVEFLAEPRSVEHLLQDEGGVVFLVVHHG